MKRNSLTTAIVAGIAGIAGFAGLATAVDLNPDSLGQVLVYPYYTVDMGTNDRTVIATVDSETGKPVKVRFLEGYNSREVLDFNLYLTSDDMWLYNAEPQPVTMPTLDDLVAYASMWGPAPSRYSWDFKS